MQWLSFHLQIGFFIGPVFPLVRLGIMTVLILMIFAFIYYFGPNVDQGFRWITPGSVLGGLSLIIASILFGSYVDTFGSFEATYGSLGAVIILMLWLYIVGLVFLFGGMINFVLLEISREI